jgi:putative hydrolase of the HAD superfamily
LAKRNSSPFRYLLCDLDDTLYPKNTGLMKAIGDRINRYMIEVMGMPADAASEIRREYHDRYGTSMRGLIVNHGIEPESYLGFVHQVPYEEFLTPNPALDVILAEIPLDKVIFTNATREHAGRVLDILGLGHHFDRIIDVRDFDFCSKPHPNAYARSLELLDATPDECIFVEDSARNLAPAMALGIKGVLVGDGSSYGFDIPPHADIRIDTILEIKDAIQDLLVSDGTTPTPARKDSRPFPPAAGKSPET